MGLPGGAIKYEVSDGLGHQAVGFKYPMFTLSRGGACGRYRFLPVRKFRARKGSASETGQPELDTVDHGIRAYCRRTFRNKIRQLLSSWPEFGVFINGPTVKGFSELGPVFQICSSLIGLPRLAVERAARSCLFCRTANGVCHPRKTCSGRNGRRVELSLHRFASG